MAAARTQNEVLKPGPHSDCIARLFLHPLTLSSLLDMVCWPSAYGRTCCCLTQHPVHVATGQARDSGEQALAERLQLLHQMLLRLLAAGCAREAEAVAGSMAAAARLLQGLGDMTQRMSAWTLEACEEAPEVRMLLPAESRV